MSSRPTAISDFDDSNAPSSQPATEEVDDVSPGQSHAKEKKVDFNWLDLWDRVESAPTQATAVEQHGTPLVTPDRLSSSSPRTPDALFQSLPPLSPVRRTEPHTTCDFSPTPPSILPSLSLGTDLSQPSQASTILLTPPSRSQRLFPLLPPQSIPTHGQLGTSFTRRSYDERTLTLRPTKVNHLNQIYNTLNTAQASLIPQSPASLNAPLHPSPSIPNSPFARLGLLTPRPHSSQPSPTRTPKFSSSTSVAPTPKPFLRPESPEWEPDTPTPIRFIAPNVLFERPSPPVFSTPTTPVSVKTERKPTFSSPLALLPDVPPVKEPDRAQQQQRTEIDTDTDPSQTAVTWTTHLSTDGGLLHSLKRLKAMTKAYPEIGGASLFLNTPRKRVKTGQNARSWEEVGACAGLLASMGEEFRSRMMAHAVHTTNLLSSDEDLRNHSKASIIAEMRYARELGIPTVVIHLGSNRTITSKKEMLRALRRLVWDLTEVVRAVPGITLALENTVHASRLTSLATLASFLRHLPESVKLCIDLCHLHVAEYDLNDPSHREQLFKVLERIGRENIVGVHVSDSSVPHGGGADRHANIGFGLIDISSLRQIMRHPTLLTLPLLLETPPYFKHLRPRSPSYITLRIISLESERAANERAFVQALVTIPESDWESGGREKSWEVYRRSKRRVESRIYKIVRGAEEMWEVFKEGKEKEKQGACRRLVQGVNRRTKDARSAEGDGQRSNDVEVEIEVEEVKEEPRWECDL